MNVLVCGFAPRSVSVFVCVRAFVAMRVCVCGANEQTVIAVLLVSSVCGVSWTEIQWRAVIRL